MTLVWDNLEAAPDSCVELWLNSLPKPGPSCPPVGPKENRSLPLRELHGPKAGTAYAGEQKTSCVVGHRNDIALRPPAASFCTS